MCTGVVGYTRLVMSRNIGVTCSAGGAPNPPSLGAPSAVTG
jgi:hypothetical protein